MFTSKRRGKSLPLTAGPLIRPYPFRKGWPPPRRPGNCARLKMGARCRRQAPTGIARLPWPRCALGPSVLAGRRLSTSAHARRTACGRSESGSVLTIRRSGG